MGDRQDIPLPHSPYDLEIVLVGINHPGNLGAVCRTMLNHGFDRLSLVNANCSVDDEEARNRAKHSGKILDNAQIFTDLDSCISNSSLVIGTSGKREVGSKILKRHFILPWEFSEMLRDYSGKVSLIFGEEGKGLSTEDLDKCDLLLTLPTWEGYPIANLSQAVGHCVYELHRDRMKNRNDIVGVVADRSLHPNLRTILKQSIHEMTQAMDTDKQELVSDVLERVILRGLPTDLEAERIIGALIQSTTALEYSNKNENWKRDRRKRINPSK